MAKYTVSHACGHDQVHDLTGPGKERERRLSWLEGTDCTACYHFAKEAAREAQNKAAAEAARQSGLPALAGSEKQVAWAETIRLPVARNLSSLEARGLLEGDFAATLSPVAIEEVADALALISTEVLGQVEARWWIDNRDGMAADLADPRRACRRLLGQVRDRGLAPTLFAEAEAEQARQKAEAEARPGRIAALAAAIRVDDATTAIEPGGRITVEDGDLRASYHNYWTLCDAAGQIAAGLHSHQVPESLTGPVLRLRDEAEARARAAADAALDASLAGVAVASATASKKRDWNLTVTLSDGRVAIGDYRVKSGCAIAKVGGSPVDAGLPEIRRIAAEAGKVVVRG